MLRCLLALALLLTVPLGAQEVTAGVYGTVQDASSAVIPHATVRLRNLGTGRTHQALTDESGSFSLTLIPIGDYEVAAEAQGFKKAVIDSVTLRVNENRRI